MGLFHCPCGAAYYDDDACIDCGMCYAKTSAERVAASKKIRAFIKAHAVKSAAPKKIAICGKGGVGKSTLTALLAQVLLETGKTVFVLDTDESNPGLSRLFGIDRLPEALITIREPPSLGEAPDAAWLDAEEISTAAIPDRYMVQHDGFRFLLTGKVEDPFQGCACSIAGVTRDLIEKLVVAEGEVVVIDMGAGVESFGRGVERCVDTVLMVVEPSHESIAVAEKIAYMAEGMGIARVFAVLNKVSSEDVRVRVVEALEKKGISIAGTVFVDNRLSEAALSGEPLVSATAGDDIKTVVRSVMASEDG